MYLFTSIIEWHCNQTCQILRLSAYEQIEYVFNPFLTQATEPLNFGENLRFSLIIGFSFILLKELTLLGISNPKTVFKSCRRSAPLYLMA